VLVALAVAMVVLAVVALLRRRPAESETSAAG